jgi:Tol biopolymer transport system component
MSRKLPLILLGLTLVACDAASSPPQTDVALAGAVPYRAGSTPFLQDTARTVTRRILPDADLYDISPDGRLAVYTDWTTGDLAIRDLETGEERHLTHNRARFDPGGAEDARFSPDGRWVAYTWYEEAQPAFYKLGVVDIEGANPSLNHRDPATGWIHAADWSPGGGHILAFRNVAGKDANELLLISAEDGRVRLLKDFPDPATGGSDGYCFSPDGRSVAYDSWRGNPEDTDIFVIEVATGEERPLVENGASDEILGWAPGGQHLLFLSNRSGTPGAWVLPVEDGRANGDPWLVKPDMWRSEGVRFSPDGRYYYKVGTGRRDVHVVGFDPEARSVIGSPTAVSGGSPSNASHSVWSPDGRHLAYAVKAGPMTAMARIAVRSMETGDVMHFELGEPGQVATTGWTADGRSVLVRVFRPGDEDDRLGFFWIDVQTGRKEPATGPGLGLTYPRLDPDRRFKLSLDSEFNSEGQARFFIRRTDLASGDTTTLFQTPSGGWGQVLSPTLSPDGETLAFGYSPVVGSRPHSLILLPTTGEEPRELPIEGVSPIAWMPDGDAMLLIRFVGLGPIWDVWYLDLAREEPQPIGLTARGGVITLDVHPDGRSITYTSTTGGYELWVMEDFLPGAGEIRGGDPHDE